MPEAGQSEGSISTTEFVAALYQGILGREPDQAGWDHYVDRIDHGAGLDEIVRSILESEEAELRRLRGARERYWQARIDGPERPLCFLHILKTGGTALVSALRRLLRHDLCLTGLFIDHLAAVPNYALERSALIAGHLPLEAVDLLPARSVICTVLRDPLERTLSHYSHLTRDPNVRRAEPDFSLERFVLAPEWRNHSSNHQARHLVHRIGIAGAWKEFSPRKRLADLGYRLPPESPHPLDALFSCTPLEIPDDELQEKATEVLRSIELVGVTDHLDSIFRKAARVVGITDPPPLLRENIGSNRVRRADLPDALIDTILEKNSVDQALYDRAVALQNETPSSRPPRSDPFH